MSAHEQQGNANAIGVNNNVPPTNQDGPHANPQGTGQPAGHPRPEVTTGNTAMTTFSAGLAADYQLNRIENQQSYPLFQHRIDCQTLFAMAQNIVKPLVLELHRAFGVNDPTAPNATLSAIIDSVAYESLFIAHAIMYGKAVRISGSYANLFGGQPRTSSLELPTYLSALLSALGPVTFDSVPTRGTHIPFVSLTTITNLRPANHNAYNLGRFIEQALRSKTVATTRCNSNVIESDPWWTFHVLQNDVEGSILYSPVKFPDSNLALKAGALFAGSKLTEGPGPATHSGSGYYDLNDNPRIDNLPAEAKTFPYFVRTQPAYYFLFERFQPRDPTPEPTASSSTNNSAMELSATPGNTAPVHGKKRKLPDGSDRITVNTNPLHRVVYYYFDHIAAQYISADQLTHWSLGFNNKT